MGPISARGGLCRFRRGTALAAVAALTVAFTDAPERDRATDPLRETLGLGAGDVTEGGLTEAEGGIWLALPGPTTPIAFMPVPDVPPDLPCVEENTAGRIRRSSRRRNAWWAFGGASPRLLQIELTGIWYGPDDESHAFFWAWDAERECAVRWPALHPPRGETVFEVSLEPPADRSARTELAPTRLLEVDILPRPGPERLVLSETRLRIEGEDGAPLYEHAAPFADEKWMWASPATGRSTWRNCPAEATDRGEFDWTPTWPCRAALSVRQVGGALALDLVFERHLARRALGSSLVERESLRLVPSSDTGEFRIEQRTHSSVRVYNRRELVEEVADQRHEVVEHDALLRLPVADGVLESHNDSHYEHDDGYVRYEGSLCFEEGDGQGGTGEIVWRFVPEGDEPVELARGEDTEGNNDRDCLIEDFDAPETTRIAAGRVTLGLTDDALARHQEACRQAGSDRCSASRFARERPAVSVDVPREFRIHETEVSRANYERCVRDGVCPAIDESTCQIFDGEGWGTGRELPQRSRGADDPRTCVTRAEADAFCAWVGGRLPSEAEWQLAASGPEGRIFAWGDGFDPIRASYLGGAAPELEWGYSRPKGSTPQGLRHMSGNAYEWVADDACGYDERSDDPAPYRNGGSQGVVRGGSFASDAGGIRTTYRRFVDVDARLDTNGFRCAFDADWQMPER